MKKSKPEKYILIIDFGSQVTQLIARRLRELKVYCEIMPFQKITKKEFKSNNPAGIILSGGPSSVISNYHPKLSFNILKRGIPVLGICYGQQLMTSMMDGEVFLGLISHWKDSCGLLPRLPRNCSIEHLRILKLVKL